MNTKRLYPLINLALQSYGNIRSLNYDINNTILAVSSPRGGSTWLSEILGTLPGYNVIWEPLHLRSNPRCIDYNFTWQNYLTEDAIDDARKNYLDMLFRGKALSTNVTMPSQNFSYTKFLFMKGYIVKFINASMLLPWLTKQFDLKAIYMIRHPCAIISSQLLHGSWDHLTKDRITIPPKLFSTYPHMQAVFEEISTIEEILAFEWAIQQYVPLNTKEPNWLFVSYEKLVMDGKNELERIFNYIDKPIPKKAFDQLHIASAMASKDPSFQKKNPLASWQSNLTKTQISNILKVTQGIGINMYSENLEPDI